MGKFAFINGRLIDGTGQEPKDGWGLVVDGKSILSVGPVGSLSVPADAEVMDVAGRTLMPGIIDAHTHVDYDSTEWSNRLRDLFWTLETNTIKAVANAKTIIETGCTAIGDGGCRGDIAAAVRDGVNEGTIPGPKMVAAAQMLCGSGGIVDPTFEFGYVDSDHFMGVVVNGPQEVRTEVRKQMRRGVNHVKVAASGGPGNVRLTGRQQDLSYEEIAAAVQEAAKFGKPVHAHAHDRQGIIDSARAGVISLHSGEFADEEGLQVMKETGCIFVPTISWLHYACQEEHARALRRPQTKISDAVIKWALEDRQQAYEACREAIVKAFQMGTPTAIGSDAAHRFPPYDVVSEMEYFQELGIPPLQIITAATQTAAQAIGRGDVWGTLEPGKAADILVVDGDPSQDVSILRDKSNILMTVQDGRVIKDSRAQAPVVA